MLIRPISHCPQVEAFGPNLVRDQSALCVRSTLARRLASAPDGEFDPAEGLRGVKAANVGGEGRPRTALPVGNAARAIKVDPPGVAFARWDVDGIARRGKQEVSASEGKGA